ncbi:MAG: HD domain-containing protein [Bryobacterales bacterium]|nr:HD domain-containing protein [Bryobacterales bacterium]
MKSPYIADLEPSQLVTGTFLVQSKDVRQKKGGEHFLSLMLSDRTGDIDAKMWDNVDKIMDAFDRDDFVRVKGVAQIYHNKLQFTIHTLVPVPTDEVDLADFFPASKRDPEEMWAELTQVVAGVGNVYLRKLLEAFLADPGVAPKFKRAPAAKTIHHAWLGGLLEHVLSLCSLVKLVAPHYPHVDQDLVMTGAILHDIGKIDELTYERTFGYSDNGQLLGHILIGMRMIDEKIRTIPDFPPRLRTIVDHLILSHHGELEFGSPKVPLLAEAMLLHHLDNLDSKIECMRSAIEKDKLADGCWTTYISSLDRPVLKKSKYLEPDQPTPAPAAPVASSGSTATPAASPAPANHAPRPDRPIPAAPRSSSSAPSGGIMADKLRAALGSGGGNR